MPYIKKKERIKFKWIIDNAVSLLQENPEELAGKLNYLIFSILKRLSKDLRYKKANELIGVLECVKQEYYRRVLAVYEDQKIKEHGDIE